VDGGGGPMKVGFMRTTFYVFALLRELETEELE
jgi:hypothetical protein